MFILFAQDAVQNARKGLANMRRKISDKYAALDGEILGLNVQPPGGIDPRSGLTKADILAQMYMDEMTARGYDTFAQSHEALMLPRDGTAAAMTNGMIDQAAPPITGFKFSIIASKSAAPEEKETYSFVLSEPSMFSLSGPDPLDEKRIQSPMAYQTAVGKLKQLAPAAPGQPQTQNR